MDKNKEIEYRPLGEEFRSEGFTHTQIFREGDKALFAKTSCNGTYTVGFEVVIIRRHDGYYIGENEIPPSEIYPNSNLWGTVGWSYPTFPDAKNAYEKLLAGETPTDAGDRTEAPVVEKQVIRRPRRRSGTPIDLSSVEIPDGEFTMEQISKANGMDKLRFYPIAKQLQNDLGKIVEIRRESRGRGRPTVIYAKRQLNG